MFDGYDVFAFIVMAVLIAIVVVVVVSLGQLPGQIARRRGHPQAEAVNVAGWLGIASLGLLWPIAFVWAFIHPARSSADDTELSPKANAGSAS